MINKTMQVINAFNKPKKGYVFAVKEKVGVYHVFDARTEFLIQERKLSQQVFEDKETADLYEEVYKLMEASYSRNGNTFVFIDPECQEYEDIELPLYRKSSKGIGIKEYIYTGSSYMIKHVPTLKMVMKSEEYAERLAKEMLRTSLIGEIEMTINISADGVSTIVETDYAVTPEFVENDDYHLFSIEKPYRGLGSYKTLVIKKSLIKDFATDGVLPLAIPKDMAGIVIGKGGRCTKEMAKALGLKYIDVKAY